MARTIQVTLRTLALSTSVLLLFAACAEEAPECSPPGAEIACTCPSGAPSQRVCEVGGTFGPCQCGADPDAGATSDTGATPDAGAGDPDAAGPLDAAGGDGTVGDPDAAAGDVAPAPDATDPDAGPPGDAAPRPDAEPDAGPGMDAAATDAAGSGDAAETDAGPSLDAAVGADAAPSPDAAVGFDAAPSPDAATGDAGPGADGGPSFCRYDLDCSPPFSICEAGACVPGCNNGGAACPDMNCSVATGRCATLGGICLDSTDCAPPTTVCSGVFCRLSCTLRGCGAGEACDGATGLCETITQCTSDLECGAPKMICEGSSCVLGCDEPGATPCASNERCDPGSGRCLAAGRCLTDVNCNQPLEICVNGRCADSCAGFGGTTCPGGSVCEHATGHCVTPGTTAAGDACQYGTDCASGVCYDFPVLGGRCVDTCSRGDDCPGATRCSDRDGAWLCVSNLSGAVPGLVGATCASFAECKSSYCDTTCVESCRSARDCGGAPCSWDVLTDGERGAACRGGRGRAAAGASCQADEECESSVCYDGACRRLCGAASDCDAGEGCATLITSFCPDMGGPIGDFCSGGWALSAATVCLPREAGRTTPTGGPCTSGDTCAGGFCTDDGICTEACAEGGDCPPGWICGPVEVGEVRDLLGRHPIQSMACLPR